MKISKEVTITLNNDDIELLQIMLDFCSITEVNRTMDLGTTNLKGYSKKDINMAWNLYEMLKAL